jgi:hypothetical protein
MYANVAGKVDQHSAYRYSKITGDRNTRREIREVTTPYAFEWNFINADDNKKTNQQDVTIAPSTGLISSDTVTIAYSLPSKYSGKPLKLKNRLFVRPTNERVVSRERLFEIDREAKTRLHMLKSLHEANRTAKNGNVSKTEKSGIIKKNTIADLKSADSVLNRDAEIEILRRKRAKIAESEFVNEGEGIVGQTFTDIESQHEQGKMISDNSSFQESAQTFSNEPINFLQLHKSESFIEPLELRMNLTTIPSSHTAHRGQFSGDNLSSTPQRKAVQSSNANIIKTSISGFNEENVSNSNALSVFSWY